VKTQDILLELNGKPVNVRFPEEIASARKMIADLPIGTQVSMKLKRGKETVSVTATTQKLEGAVGEEKELKTWGVSVRDVTHTYANERQLDDDLGVVVTTLSPGFPAQKAELSPGDVIRAVNGSQATDLEALMKLYQASIDKKEPRVLLEIKRGRGTRSAVMKVNY
jgi:serine protease Do